MNAPLYPLEGVVSWNMNTTCNYRCSYCTQRFLDDRAQWAQDLPTFVEALLALPGDWAVKLSGGEPFRHPGFLGAVEALARGGRRVGVVTNLAASRERLAHFAEAVATRPGVVSASLHLEYVSSEAFLAKVKWYAGVHRGPMVVTCVATRENLSRLHALKGQFEAAGLSFRVQPEKKDRDVIAYTKAERAEILALGGHNDTGLVHRYLVVDHRGEAWRCYPARRYRKEYLGNLLDGTLHLQLRATPCPYRYCNCTVPRQRGMVM
ncbi:MAG: radical SAM protein, partial [Deltaproteobacteria bacterium]|nr:radical SAM protein [Deltaproteobacteria bacterium]